MKDKLLDNTVSTYLLNRYDAHDFILQIRASIVLGSHLNLCHVSCCIPYQSLSNRSYRTVKSCSAVTLKLILDGIKRFGCIK